ncbi:MAG TPA: hypothetical protein VFU45_07585 [Gemmatimonadales bacterium]|nr:hypothetical protein [Gemmatimonadales bacterium]
MKGRILLALLAAVGACRDASAPSTATGSVPDGLIVVSGDRQGLDSGATPSPLVVQLWNKGKPVAGAVVHWEVTRGGATISDSITVTDGSGTAAVTVTPGSAGFGQGVEAGVAGVPPVDFSLTLRRPFQVLGGGNNVAERYTSDLWLAKGYGYTGTWGFRSAAGNVIKVWQLGGGGAPALVGADTIAGVNTVSDLQVSPDSTLLVATGESGPGAGLYVYGLTDPAHPALLAQWSIASATQGLHTGTLAEIGGQLYAFTARDPSAPSLLTFRVQPDSLAKIVLVDSIAMPANYGIHDTFVRDGLLFVENWNSGMWIYDVGGGGLGGSPGHAVFIGSVVTQGGEVHNAWWFHDPVTNEKRYVFIGQEGPDVIGVSSAGDIHVVDVSDLSAPVEVAHFHLGTTEGPHNFWMDEQRQVLYAAYYNGGVVALDVSGTLSGDLGSREIAEIQPGGSGDTYVWGVMLYGGSLYATDMVSGLWQLTVP